MTTQLAQALLAHGYAGQLMVGTALHEGGHVVAFLEGRIHVDSAAAWLNRAGFLGQPTSEGEVRHLLLPDDPAEMVLLDEREITAYLVAAYAGAEAHAAAYQWMHDCSPDEALAFAYGYPSGSDQEFVQYVVDRCQVDVDHVALMTEAGELVRDYWGSVEAIGDALLEHGHLDAGQIAAVVYG